MPLVTSEMIRLEAARRIGALLWSGVATNGTRESMWHTGNGGLRDSDLSPTLVTGGYLLATSGLEDGNWRQIKGPPNGYAQDTGTVTWSEPFDALTGGFAPGMSYEILTWLDPDQWRRVINDAIHKLRYKTRTPLTLVTDGDMESPTTSSWTAVNAVITKTQGPSPFIQGERAMRVINTATGGYAQSASIAAAPGLSYGLWASYLSASSSARMAVYDSESGKKIADGQDYDNGVNAEGGTMSFGFTVPPGTRYIVIRLIGDGVPADIWWDDVILNRAGSRRYPLPPWIEELDQFHEVVIRYGTRVREYGWESVGHPIDVEEDRTGVTPFRVVLPTTSSRPFYVVGQRPFAPLPTDAATTTCPLEWAKMAAAAEAIKRHARNLDDRAQAALRDDQAEIERELAYLSRRLQPRYNRPIGHQTEWVAGGGQTWVGPL